MELNSPNFQFLEKHDPHLLKLAAGTETYCFPEPEISLTRSRQLAEAIAFRSQLVPQDPTDEPASALLARLRQQRESEATTKPKKKTTRKRPKPA